MEQFLAFSLKDIPYVAITLMIAFTIHEYAHAIVAYKFGDPTAKNEGRLTLNPMQHLDPIGTILIFIAGFGWARPVPVNRFFFNNPRLAGILVSLAGPLSNLILGMVGFIVWYGMLSVGMEGSIPSFVPQFLNIFIQLNFILFVFNLLPFPPLDGYRIISDLVPTDVRPKLTNLEKYGALIFIILVITPLNRYTIQPIFSIVLPVLFGGLNEFFYQLFMN